MEISIFSQIYYKCFIFIFDLSDIRGEVKHLSLLAL